MECVEAFLGDFAVDDLLDFSNTDAFVREDSSSSSQREEEDEQERGKAKSFSDQSTRLSPLEDLLSLPTSELDVPVSPLAHSVSLFPVFALILPPLFIALFFIFVLFCL